MSEEEEEHDKARLYVTTPLTKGGPVTAAVKYRDVRVMASWPSTPAGLQAIANLLPYIEELLTDGVSEWQVIHHMGGLDAELADFLDDKPESEE